MANTDVYTLIKDTIDKSKDSVKSTEWQLTWKIWADLLNNASSGLSDIFSDYAKYNDVMTHHSDRYIYSQAALSGLGLIANTLQNLQAKRAYENGPNGLVTQYLNSFIASQALDPDEFQKALIEGKIIESTHHTIGKGAVKLASNDAIKHATDAKGYSDDANNAFKDASESADNAGTDAKSASEASQNAQTALNATKEAERDAKAILQELKNLLEEAKKKQ